MLHLRPILTSVAFVTVALTSQAVLAGEIKVGQEPLAVDKDGKLSADGRKAAVEQLDEIPGEDTWVAHIWASLDNRAPGPLYFEFFQEVAGQNSVVLRHEVADYDGGKYWSGEIELPGRIGFNKERTYTIKAVQVNAKGKDIELAKGKIKLIKSGKAPPKQEEDDEDDRAAQDEADSLGGDDDEGDAKPAAGGSEAPPPVEPTKKGCTVDVADHDAWSGALILLGIGGLALRRRR